MSSNDIYSSYGAEKQQEVIHKLQILFKGNDRFHGAGNVVGAKFEEEKNKWKPGNPRCEHRTLTEDDWRAHLLGERFIGLSPLQDDGTVWFTCIDVDKLENSAAYDFDYANEMWKIKNSKLPLVVFRTKSGGLRITIFFSESIDAEYAVKRMKQIAAQLGYAGQEIFPKQTKVTATDGKWVNPAWIFLPFGPTADIFPDQCCMNEAGNAMELYEAIIYAMKKRISMKELGDLFVTELKARENGKANGKRYDKGLFVWPENESYDLSVWTMFQDGPICLYYIALEKCGAGDQHYFLFNCCVFFRRKYPTNWEEALKWVNFNVLRPVGNGDKLTEMIRDFKGRGERPYEYTCKNPPICNRCHASACKKQPFGVGVGNGVDHYELGITAMMRGGDTTFFVNVGNERVPFTAHELSSPQIYREKCLAYTVTFPPAMKKQEWERIVQNSLENATKVEPPSILKKNINEIEMLQAYFSVHIPSMVRAKGDEYLRGLDGDFVRVRDKDKEIYFKWQSCALFCRRMSNDRQVDNLRGFLGEHGIEHDRTDSKGGWYRSSISVPYDLFDPLIIEHWLHPEEEEKDE